MIKYKIGDATEPIVEIGTRVIAHICNDIGKWGDGFSGAISKKWKEPEDYYKRQYRYAKDSFKLGKIQWVFVDLDLAVVNMIAQKGVRSKSNKIPICYESVERCLSRLAKGCIGLMGSREDPSKEVTVHIPRIGCGLAGGSWDIIEPIIEEIFWDLDVYVYDIKVE